MDAKDDIELLREYATGRSETAFTSLVQRHIHFVYSSALRQVYNAHLAEEVTQAVFIILARKAGSLRQGTILAGWLFNTARFVAAAELRAIARRHKHEQEAGMESTHGETTPDASWEQIAPFLDDGLAQLNEKDRQAVLLRFFERKSFREVADKHAGIEVIAGLFLETRIDLFGHRLGRRAFHQRRSSRARQSGNWRSR
jgi:RNA polymerase sigma factor (sigma-70 family)